MAKDEPTMKTFVLLVISLVFSMVAISQEIGIGKYRLCYDMHWRCHFQNLLELKIDSTYEFTYIDDTQMKQTKGSWRIDQSCVVLTPSFIPDTIQITDVLELSNKNSNMNIIQISESFKGTSKLGINCYYDGLKKTVETDSLGEYYYDGAVVDSLTFSIQGRDLKVITKQKNAPSIIRITIDSDCKDLVYQQLGINKIMIRNGKMMVKYKDSENGILKTEYFEKIE
jgi:hypothetical protein